MMIYCRLGIGKAIKLTRSSLPASNCMNLALTCALIFPWLSRWLLLGFPLGFHWQSTWFPIAVENLCRGDDFDSTSKLMGVRMHHFDGHHQSLTIKQSTNRKKSRRWPANGGDVGVASCTLLVANNYPGQSVDCYKFQASHCEAASDSNLHSSNLQQQQ